MLLTGAAAAALIASPGLRWCVALATGRSAEPRLVAAAALGAALLIAWRAEGVLHGSALAAVAAAGIVAGWVDVYERRLPDVLMLPPYPLVAALLLGTGDAGAMLRAALCAAAGMAVFGLGCAAGQMGFGDVKLAGLLGLVVGWVAWQTALLALATAVVVGGVQAVAVLASRRDAFPFGPAMLLGAAFAVAAAPVLVC